MGLRFNKRIKIADGVNMNIGKKSVGLSVGGKGARYSINSSGRKTATVGIPGTGISYSIRKGPKKSSAKGKGQTYSTATATTTMKKTMKTGMIPLIVTVLLGWLGIHWFISGRIGMGLLYMFTFGLFGIGWFVDIIKQIIGLVRILQNIDEIE